MAAIRTGSMTINPAPRRSLHDQVIWHLGQQIVSGSLKAGAVLPREELLAQQLAVSRTALREAMKVLAAKGLVESRPKVGTRVRDPRFWQQLDGDVLAWRCESMPTRNFVQKLIEMRDIIEPAAAAAAAERCNAEQLQRIDAACAAMAAAPDLDSWTAADTAFHKAILEGTGNELLISLFTVIEASMSMFFQLSAHTAKDFKYSLPLHQKVLESIRRRKPEAARRAMRHIIADSRDNMASAKSRKAHA